MTEQSHSVSEVLQSLAPAGLPLYRAQRYDGGGFSVSLRQFAPEDISLIIQLYTAVKRTYDLWLYMKDAPNYKMLASHIQREFSSDQFLNSMRLLARLPPHWVKPAPSFVKLFTIFGVGRWWCWSAMRVWPKLVRSSGWTT